MANIVRLYYLYAMQNIAALVLAAGSSSRLGQSKQLLMFRGKTLLRHSVEAAVESRASDIIVVLGSRSDIHAKEVSDLPVSICTNDNWEKGMGNSLKCGLDFVEKYKPTTKGILVMVCDQPAITFDHLNKMIDAFGKSDGGIIASVYNGGPGVPAIFDRSHFDAIKKLNDEKGARSIIKANVSKVTSVPFPGGEIDIDTIADYKKL